MRKKGWLTLATQSLAVIAASFGALNGSQEAIASNLKPDNNDDAAERKNFKNLLKPKLILSLNLTNPQNSILAMHTSHSSHSSHASHASHYSGSSGSTYTPTYTPPPTKPTSLPIAEPIKSREKPSGFNNSKTYATSSLIRVLIKGCEGADVEMLQKLLVMLHYDTPVTSYFGDKTEIAVKQFQKDSELNPDGKVGEKTFSILRSKTDEL